MLALDEFVALIFHLLDGLSCERLHQSSLADPRLARDKHNLAFAVARYLQVLPQPI
jgi:hypothetical protein